MGYSNDPESSKLLSIHIKTSPTALYSSHDRNTKNPCYFHNNNFWYYKIMIIYIRLCAKVFCILWGQAAHSCRTQIYTYKIRN